MNNLVTNIGNIKNTIDTYKMLTTCKHMGAGILLCVYSSLGVAFQTSPHALSQVSIEPVEVALHNGSIAAEQGILHAPELHQRPDGQTMEIIFHRFKTHHKSPAPPIFLIAGGPGNTYIDDFADEDFAVWLRTFLDKSDVITLEHRGSLTSGQALTCLISMNTEASQVVTPQMYYDMFSNSTQKCTAKYKAEGVNFDAYTIEQMAYDIHLLKQLLGYEKISLMGGSFGSQLGLATIKAQPNSIYRAVFYGVEGLDNTLDDANLVDQHLDRVSAVMSESIQFNWLVGDFKQALQEKLAALSVKPMDNGQVKVGAFDLKLMLWSSQGIKGYRRGITNIGRLFLTDALGIESFFFDAKKQLVDSVSNKGIELSLATFLIDCASYQDSHLSATTKDMLFDYSLIDAELRAICPNLPVPALDKQWQEAFSASTETILLAGEIDGFTPPNFAEAIHKRFENSKLIPVKRGDHSGWAALEEDPKNMLITAEFFHGITTKDSFPETIKRPPLEITLIPTWILATILLVLVGTIGLFIRRRRRKKSNIKL